MPYPNLSNNLLQALTFIEVAQPPGEHPKFETAKVSLIGMQWYEVSNLAHDMPHVFSEMLEP